jgi:Na+/proline symporter
LAFLGLYLFVLFLALNLIIGLRAGLKVESIQDFAIGGKVFSTGAVTSTIIATWTGGGFLFYALQNIYSNGLAFIIPMMGSTLCLLFMGQVLAVRMGEFLNNLSVAEAMGDLYGRVVRVITAISGIALGIGGIAIQFQVIGKMLNMLLDLKGANATVAAAIIVILYSALGGIRSVTITDIFQFIAFSIFIPILALVVWNNLKDPSEVSHTLLTNPIFSLKENIGWNPKFLSALGLLLYFAVPALSPAIFQRVSIAKDLKQVKSAFTYAAIIDFLIALPIVWIAILLLTDNPHLDPKNLVNHIISRYAYPGLKGLIAVGISAMAMSTADSDLNASAVLAVNDIMKPIWPKWTPTIIKLRFFTASIGLCALALALRSTNMLELLLGAGSYYMPIVSVPLLLAIFGFRSSSTSVLMGSVLMGMAAGALIVIFWDKLAVYTGLEGLDPIIPGMLANLIFLMGSHYLLRQAGGWVGIKDKAPLLAARQERKEYWQRLLRTIKETNIYSYLQENLPSYDLIYSLFGVYVLGATYSLFFTIPEQAVLHYQRLYDIAAHSVLICTAAFLTYPAWPPTFRAKWFITYAWPIGICYILFVVGTQLVIMSGFHQVQVMIFLLNLIVTAMLLAWPLILAVAMAGITIGYLIFTLQYGPIELGGALASANFNFVYGILLCSSFLLIILMMKQRMKHAEEKQRYLEKSYTDNKAELAQVVQYSEEVLSDMVQMDGLFNKTAIEYIHQAIYRIKDYMQLNVAPVTIDQLLQDVKATIRVKDASMRPRLVVEKMTGPSKLIVDPSKIQELLVTTLSLIQQNNSLNKPIRIVLEEATLGYQVKHMKGYTKEVAALQFVLTLDATLPPSQPIYFIHPTTLKEQMARLPSTEMAENIRIVDAHYGYGKIIAPTTYVYVIPINVREVRGKVMELLRQPIAPDPEELAHPVAINLERELFDRLAATSIPTATIKKALEIIKKYHAGVKRKSGEPFFTHPIAVALILLEYCQDQDAIIAALLHDTVEDTSLSTIHIKALFGETVAFLVGKVTNLEGNLRRLTLEDHENAKRLIDYEDKRAVYVKLADRLHNMRTIQGHSNLQKQKHIAHETLTFFVPMAKELGLLALAEELEERSLAVLGKKL